ncbi:MAG TPA: hypothetical protein ENK25_03655 [Bacteroidetes bacterium]|nr:hypothetical protein [Bacteroidota bacterium]
MEDRRGKNLDTRVKRLENENRMLKELFAEKVLESKMKDELSKKGCPMGQRKAINGARFIAKKLTEVLEKEGKNIKLLLLAPLNRMPI